MVYRIHHVHIKSERPEEVAEFYNRAFGFSIISDEVRALGDRILLCRPQTGDVVMIISGQRAGEHLDPGSASPRFGLDHLGIETSDLHGDLERLQTLGATLVEGPFRVPDGPLVAFLTAPGDVRIELMQPLTEG